MKHGFSSKRRSKSSLASTTDAISGNGLAGRRIEPTDQKALARPGEIESYLAAGRHIDKVFSARIDQTVSARAGVDAWGHGREI